MSSVQGSHTVVERSGRRIWLTTRIYQAREYTKLSCKVILQGDRTVVEEYQEKVAVASRKAEKVVREFEELGAGRAKGGADELECWSLELGGCLDRLGFLTGPCCLPSFTLHSRLCPPACTSSIAEYSNIGLFLHVPPC